MLEQVKMIVFLSMTRIDFINIQVSPLFTKHPLDHAAFSITVCLWAIVFGLAFERIQI